MSAIDEKIAQLKMAKRKLKQEEKEQVEEETIEDKEEIITLEEIIERIKSGKLSLNGKEFEFEEKSYLDGRIKLPIIKEFFQEHLADDKIREIAESNNGEDMAMLLNEGKGVSQIFSYYKEKMEISSIYQYKKDMEKELKKMELYAEWIDEGVTKEEGISYVTFRTPTGMGYTYNLNLFISSEDNRELILGNMNCFEEDMDTYGNIIRALIELIKIKF